MKSARARRPARRTLGATRPWTTTGYATAQWKARSARRCPPPPDPTLTRRTFFSFCGGPNPCPLDQSGQAKHHHSDPRKQTSGGRHQIGTPAGFKSESVAGFLLECVAGFVGIRTLLQASRGSFPFIELVFADTAYAGKRVADATRIVVEIVHKITNQVGFVLLPRRWVVERTFAWLNRNRRLAKDFESTIATATAFLYAASIMLLTRRLARAA